jgi:uncharacterized protein (AIM24 family)
MHRSVQGALSGAGLMQPKLEGRGVFVVESPVPPDELEQVDLDGAGELIVDGDLMLMYSSTCRWSCGRSRAGCGTCPEAARAWSM